MTRPTLFLLHGLGCSARTWDDVAGRLRPDFDVVALDLPGHGANRDSAALTVEQAADHVLSEILIRRPSRWAVVGHSMGGKLAMIVTARAERGGTVLPAPVALVLVAPSPPGPEPMADDARAEMISWCARGSVSEQHARDFVSANIARPLPDQLMTTAVEDVQRVERTAWLGWLERGSLEDWSDPVGTLTTPALVLAGAGDGDLGVDAQRSATLAHLAGAELVVVPQAAHLIMLEQPAPLAELIAAHVGGVLAGLDELPPPYTDLIMSDRVSSRTRGVLTGRLAPPPAGSALTDTQRAVLAALVSRVLPQRGTTIDLTARLEARLAAGNGDGWRFADLPEDVTAWRRGFDTLAARASGFVDLAPQEMDGWIGRIVDGDAGSDRDDHLTGPQLAHWFEDVRAEAVRAWISHPAAMARIG